MVILIDYMQIVEITSSSQKSYFSFVLFYSVRSCRNQTNILQTREQCISLICANANAKTCVRVSRRACISCIYLVRDLMIISHCATGKECVIVTRVSEYTGAINIQFFDRIGYVYFRVRKLLPFPHFIATNNAVIIRTHCQALR